METIPKVIYKDGIKPHSWCRWSVYRVKKRNNSVNVRFVGNTGCLSGDTEVRLSRGAACRKYTLESLYAKYQGIKQKNGRAFDLKIPSYIRSFNGKEIRLHKIKEVSYSGIKKVFELSLENGLKIKATEDHKFLTRSEEWVQLKYLQGLEVMCDTPNTEAKNRKRIKLSDIGLPVGRNHPYNTKANGQIEVHRLIYEAKMNNLSFIAYLDILLNEPEICKTLNFVDTSIYLIHHKDGCHYNNSLENLELLDKNKHYLEHNVYSNFSQGIPKFSKVVDIRLIGEERTYDIECEEPYHNFVANNIIVHNSGKSWSALFFCEECARMMGKELNKEDVYFSIKDVLDKVARDDPPPGTIFFIDEQQIEAAASDYQSKRARAYSFFLSSVRSKRYIIVTTLPFADMELKKIRRFFNVEIETNGANFSTNTVNAAPRYLEYSRKQKDKIYRKRLLVVFKDKLLGMFKAKKLSYWDIPKPSEKIIHIYEQMKADFQSHLYKKLSKELSEDELNDEVLPKAGADDVVLGTLTDYQKAIYDLLIAGAKKQKDINEKLIEQGFHSSQAKVSQNKKWMRKKGVIIIK
jgi:hypothetical protein